MNLFFILRRFSPSNLTISLFLALALSPSLSIRLSLSLCLYVSSPLPLSFSRSIYLSFYGLPYLLYLHCSLLLSLSFSIDFNSTQELSFIDNKRQHPIKLSNYPNYLYKVVIRCNAYVMPVH